ncbi:MAG: hypothetical protein ACXU9L_09510 [Thermodesulfobacteriota bacterium]
MNKIFLCLWPESVPSRSIGTGGVPAPTGRQEGVRYEVRIPYREGRRVGGSFKFSFMDEEAGTIENLYPIRHNK